jgi:hypothetical protein
MTGLHRHVPQLMLLCLLVVLLLLLLSLLAMLAALIERAAAVGEHCLR